MKSGKLNFLELSGPFQACNGTALPFLRPKGGFVSRFCAVLGYSNSIYWCRSALKISEATFNNDSSKRFYV
jgi:hypothetical protein